MKHDAHHGPQGHQKSAMTAKTNTGAVSGWPRPMVTRFTRTMVDIAAEINDAIATFAGGADPRMRLASAKTASLQGSLEIA